MRGEQSYRQNRKNYADLFLHSMYFIVLLMLCTTISVLNTQIVHAQNFPGNNSNEPLAIYQGTSYATDPVRISISPAYENTAMLRITSQTQLYRIQDLTDIDNVVLNVAGNYTFYLLNKDDGSIIYQQDKTILDLPIRTSKDSYLQSEQARIDLDYNTTLIEIRNMNTGDLFVPIQDEDAQSSRFILNLQEPGEYRILCNNSNTNREYEKTITVSAQSLQAQQAPQENHNTNDASIDQITDDSNTASNSTSDSDVSSIIDHSKIANMTLVVSQLAGSYNESLRSMLSKRFSGVSVDDARTIQTISGIRSNIRIKSRNNDSVDLLGASIKNSTNATFYDPQGTSTDIIRVDNITVESATVSLTKNSQVDAIAKCEMFDESGTCMKWAKTDIPFIDLGDKIVFNVTHFSGYAGVINNTYYYAENNTALNTSTTANLTHVQMTFADPVNSKWLIIAYSEYRMNSTSTQGKIYLHANGTEVARQEKRVTTASTEVNPFYYAYVYTGDGGNEVFKINASSGAAGSRVDLLQSKILAIRLDGITNSDFNSTYNSTTRSNLNKAWSDETGDKEIITITPQTSGLYLIGGSAIYDSDNTTAGGFAQMRMRLNGTTISGTLLEQDTNTAELHSGTMLDIENLSAASYNITLEFSSNSTSTADWQQTSLFVIRLTDAFNFWYQNTTAEQSTTNTRKTVASVSANTYSSHNYTAISSSLGQISSTTYYQDPSTYVNGVAIDNQNIRPANAGEYVAVGSMDLVTGTSAIVANTTTQSSNSGATDKMKYSDIILLEVGSYPDPLSIANAQINTSGMVINGTRVKVNATVSNITSLSSIVIQVNTPTYTYNASLTQNGNEWYNDSILLNETGIWNFAFFVNDTVGSEKSLAVQDLSSSTDIDVYIPGTITLNITSPQNNTNITLNTTFQINGTIACNGPAGASCGTINAYARYNSTSPTPNVNISNTTATTPLYITDNTNPQNATLNQGDSWNFSWTINATGINGSCYYVDILSISNISAVQDNNSQNIKICMIIQPAGPPIISNITPIPSINPTIGANTTVLVNFTATDSSGVGNLNDSSAYARFTNGSITRAGPCTPNDINSTSTTYNCSVTMPFYDPAGSWQVNVSVSNNQSLNASNSTTSFTYNSLVAINVSSASFDFGSLTPGAASAAGAQNPIGVNNLGNVNITGFNITAYALANTTSGGAINPGNFSANTTNAIGISLKNNTQVAIANSSIVIRNDTNSTMNSRSVFFFITTPLGTPSGRYVSQQNWVVTTNE